VNNGDKTVDKVVDNVYNRTFTIQKIQKTPYLT